MPKDILPPCFQLELQKVKLLNKQMIVLHFLFIISGIVLVLIATWLKFFLLPGQSGEFSAQFKLLITVWVDVAIVHLMYSRMILSSFTSG